MRLPLAIALFTVASPFTTAHTSDQRPKYAPGITPTGDEVECFTNDISPKLGDLKQAAAYFYKLGDLSTRCVRPGDADRTRCTRMLKRDPAAKEDGNVLVWLCGSPGGGGPCMDVAIILDEIYEKCRDLVGHDGRAGGIRNLGQSEAFVWVTRADDV